MSLPRSNSTPVLLSGSAKRPTRAPVQRSYSTNAVAADQYAGASTMAIVNMPSMPSMAMAESTEEDPFSLGAFFPRAIGREREREWGWLRGEGAYEHAELSYGEYAGGALGVRGDEELQSRARSMGERGLGDTMGAVRPQLQLQLQVESGEAYCECTSICLVLIGAWLE